MSKMPEHNQNNEEGKGFRLPENYFQSSAAALKNKMEWIEEHKAFPSLAEFDKRNCFAAPFNYFNSSESKLELLDCINLKAIEKKNAFSVPENYFNGFVKNLENKTDVLSELQEFKNLNSIEKHFPFAAPKTYFEANAAAVHNKIEPETKIIQLPVKRTLYFSAAALLVLCLGIWLYNFYFDPVIEKDCGTLACIDKKELVKTKAIENLERDELYELVDPKKLEENLQNKDKNKNTQESSDSLADADELLDAL